jgi:dipeptidyl aminopeptidase/acylaminoacyl peptidase
MRLRTLLFALALSLSVSAVAKTTWQAPPEPIGRILDAPRSPSISISPDRQWLIETERPALPPISELAEPLLSLAGRRINPRTNGPARQAAYEGLRVGKLTDRTRRSVALPAGARMGNISWAPDSRRIAFTLTQDSGIELWVMELPDGQPRRITPTRLNAANGSPCDWLPGDEGLVCKMVPEERGPAPEESLVPEGPLVEESAGRRAAGRTYTNLLQSPHDEALFDHYLTSELVHVALDGGLTRLADAAVHGGVSPSPDGRFLLVSSMHRPYSYQFPMSRFPLRTEVLDRKGERVHLVADLPLADSIPIKYGSVRTGPRSVSWRADEPATLTWVEALDGGDAGREVDERDALHQLRAPFSDEPQELWRSELRFAGAQWGNESVAIVNESWWKTRQTRTWLVNPSDPQAAAELLDDRNYQDAYADPGSPVMTAGPHGRSVLLLSPGNKALYLSGRGASPEGVHPFLDRLDLESGAKKRLWQSKNPYYERVSTVLDSRARKFVTTRQSQEEPANYYLHRRGQARAQRLTSIEDPAPELAGIDKQLLKYEREDGVQLSATLYLPPGYDKERDGALPAVFWAYPREFKDKKTASQVTSSENTFSRPAGSSIMFLLTQGYAVVSGPTMPIIGEGQAEPNDSFIEQLVTSAEAAVDHVASLGVVDRDRCAIGGHSYGAFMTAHLLAHSDLFRAGIARSGAYNRSLTPFGFQGEERTFFAAPDTYLMLSPFTHAAKIDEPILLTHGAVDSNSGTYPIQSERMYEAIKGLGGTVRWVVLPHEDHGYRSREAVGHVLWEMTRWLDLHVKDAEPRGMTASVGQ